jgi:hypothetical protein
MEQQFGSFTASELYCPTCKISQPVRERLLLVLPTGELYEFYCASCSTSLAKRSVTGPTTPRARPQATPTPKSRFLLTR